MTGITIKKASFILLGVILLFVCSPSLANGLIDDLGPYPWPSDWINVDIVVNIANNTTVDKMKLAMAIAQAGQILNQAGIFLEVKDVNENAWYGDSDAGLTEAECREAQQHGQRELERICGRAGKGLKITVGDINDPSIPADVLGLAIHDNPVVIIEPNPDDPDEWAKTIAHELCHALTIEEDLYDGNDPNNLMWWQGDSGTELDPNQIEEIRSNALARGRPPYTDGMNYWRLTDPWGFLESLDAHGAELDDVGDVTTSDGTAIPDYVQSDFADLQSVSVFCDDVGQSAAPIEFKIQLAGAYQPESIFNAFYDVSIYRGEPDISVDPDFVLNIVVNNLEGKPQIYASIINNHTGKTYELPADIAYNKLLGCPGGFESAGNSSLRCWVSRDIFWASNSAITKPLYIYAASRTLLFTFDDLLLDSLSAPFEFGISNHKRCPNVTLGCLGQLCNNQVLNGGDDFGSKVPFEKNGIEMIAVFGHCFDCNVTVKLDGKLIGTAPIDEDGEAVYWIDGQNLGDGLHTVVLQETLRGPTGKDYAVAFFTKSPAIPGDLNRDFEVDMRDLAIMADYWLSGK